MASCHRELLGDANIKKDCFGKMPKPAGETPTLPEIERDVSTALDMTEKNDARRAAIPGL
jgi:hypothetical protein